MRDWQIECVCGGGSSTCNNGWMRRLEEKAKPVLTSLILGKEIRISETQKKQIAAWIALKCMVSEYFYAGSVTTHHTQRKRMMRIQEAPKKGWGIWIGACPAFPTGTYWATHPFFATTEEKLKSVSNPRPTHYNGQTTTLIINKLFIQVIRSPDPLFFTKWKFALPDKGRLLCIWPPSSFSIVWPGKFLSVREMRMAANAINYTAAVAARKRALAK
jgi:hypothetical protein